MSLAASWPPAAGSRHPQSAWGSAGGAGDKGNLGRFSIAGESEDEVQDGALLAVGTFSRSSFSGQTGVYFGINQITRAAKF